MAEIDLDRLIWIVTGVQLKAELGDRPLAYRIEQEVRQRLIALIGKGDESQQPRLAPAVISDVYYLNNEDLKDKPVISIGGPGVNALSAQWVEELPAAVAIEDVLLIQMDVEMHDLRCAVWGMDHLSTVRAVETFIVKGYLDTYLKGVVAKMPVD